MEVLESLRVAFTTLGCKVNQSETDTLARQFTAAGHQCVPFEDQADVYVVNTCTVTHVADKKSRQSLNGARRRNPEALIVATGCYASIVGEALAGERTIVVRNRDKDRLLPIVEGHLGRSNPQLSLITDTEKYLETSGGQERTRAMVKAQDGCDSHCTYCIIPRARGRSRSTAPDAVVSRVRALVNEGHAEVVLTGVDLGSYGENEDGFPDLGALIQSILDQTDVPRIRISSLEPGDFKSEWLMLWKSPRLCKHLHVPLQAGSDSVLQRMERRYSAGTYADMVAACRAAIPGLTVTTDVMVGFPGESGAEFDEGFHFIRSVQFDGMHVFKYSQRSGTRAARLAEQVPEDVKAHRASILREEAVAGLHRLLRRHQNQPATVAWESARDGILRGLTDTNVRIYGSAANTQTGRLTRVRLLDAFQDGLWSEPRHADIALMSAG